MRQASFRLFRFRGSQSSRNVYSVYIVRMRTGQSEAFYRRLFQVMDPTFAMDSALFVDRSIRCTTAPA